MSGWREGGEKGGGGREGREGQGGEGGDGRDGGEIGEGTRISSKVLYDNNRAMWGSSEEEIRDCG